MESKPLCRLSTPLAQQGVWQLRRVGPPSTVHNSSSLITLLEDGEVTVGRGPSATYFLDSAITLRLISRIHAKIVGGKHLDGAPKFTIFNSGLNGTYINDYKMGLDSQNQTVLLEGDKITFGHPGSASIKPGEFAAQPGSEFQFLFEFVASTKGSPNERSKKITKTNAIPHNKSPKHSGQIKHCKNIISGDPSERLADSPQSNASTSEKENEVVPVCMTYQDPKSSVVPASFNNSTSSSKVYSPRNDGFPSFQRAQNISSHQQNVRHERQITSSQSPKNLSPSTHFIQRFENRTAEKDGYVTSSDFTKKVIPSSVPSKSMFRNLNGGLEVHSTTVINLQDEDDSDNERDEVDKYDNDDLQLSPEIEYVGESGPVLPSRIKIKEENEDSEIIVDEDEDSRPSATVQGKESKSVTISSKIFPEAQAPDLINTSQTIPKYFSVDPLSAKDEIYPHTHICTPDSSLHLEENIIFHQGDLIQTSTPSKAKSHQTTEQKQLPELVADQKEGKGCSGVMKKENTDALKTALPGNCTSINDNRILNDQKFSACTVKRTDCNESPLRSPSDNDKLCSVTDSTHVCAQVSLPVRDNTATQTLSDRKCEYVSPTHSSVQSFSKLPNGVKVLPSVLSPVSVSDRSTKGTHSTSPFVKSTLKCSPSSTAQFEKEENKKLPVGQPHADSRSESRSSVSSGPSSGLSPTSRLTSLSSPNSRPSSRSSSSSRPSSRSSTRRPFVRDHVPNMYSSSDEDEAFEENKTKEIVKKIYSPKKMEDNNKSNGHVSQVSRRSTLFKPKRNNIKKETVTTSPAPSTSTASATFHRYTPITKDPHKKHTRKPKKELSTLSSQSSSDESSALSDLESVIEKNQKTLSQSGTGLSSTEPTLLSPGSVSKPPVSSLPSSVSTGATTVLSTPKANSETSIQSKTISTLKTNSFHNSESLSSHTPLKNQEEKKLPSVSTPSTKSSTTPHPSLSSSPLKPSSSPSLSSSKPSQKQSSSKTPSTKSSAQARARKIQRSPSPLLAPTLAYKDGKLSATSIESSSVKSKTKSSKSPSKAGHPIKTNLISSKDITIPPVVESKKNDSSDVNSPKISSPLKKTKNATLPNTQSPSKEKSSNKAGRDKDNVGKASRNGKGHKSPSTHQEKDETAEKGKNTTTRVQKPDAETSSSGAKKRKSTSELNHEVIPSKRKDTKEARTPAEASTTSTTTKSESKQTSSVTSKSKKNGPVKPQEKPDKPKTAQGKRQPRSRKNSASSNISSGKGKAKQQPKKGKAAPGKRKRRKKIVSDTSSEDEDEDDIDEFEDDFDVENEDVGDVSEMWDLPEGVQYYDNLCSASKCLNPEGKMVDWVMCDICEKWYHVVCVDCPVDVIQSENAQFKCKFC